MQCEVRSAPQSVRVTIPFVCNEPPTNKFVRGMQTAIRKLGKGNNPSVTVTPPAEGKKTGVLDVSVSPCICEPNVILCACQQQLAAMGAWHPTSVVWNPRGR